MGAGRTGAHGRSCTPSAERPVVRKETVGVERVRLETDKVTEEREVSEDVRKEEIQYDTDERPGKEGRGGKRGPGH
ncbi:DUF2382 domain-containing protein [Streptomyces sp. A5-4]|uniref:DUF2382 domain-containing protein n=1 Tax=Streptomyces sp. A5-4 TaxID=3384771 RepID=UPI003DA82257